MRERAVPLRLERSVLAVPASSWRMVQRAVATEADLVFLDLEDAVAPSEKESARANVVRALRELDWGRKVRAFRMNALDTPWAYRDLVEVVEQAGEVLDLVIVPKVGRPEEVVFVDLLLTQIELHRGYARPVGVEVQIETPRGVLQADRIAGASPRLEALVFGPGDYAASIQMPMARIGVPDEHDRLYPGHRWGFAMHRLVAAARAEGLRAVDGPYADVRDREGFRRSCQVARALGFDGKWCIHPDQVPIANEVFTPSPEEVAWSLRVVEAYERALQEGQGAVALDGRMIDAASLRMAQVVVEKARQAGLV